MNYDALQIEMPNGDVMTSQLRADGQYNLIGEEGGTLWGCSEEYVATIIQNNERKAAAIAQIDADRARLQAEYKAAEVERARIAEENRVESERQEAERARIAAERRAVRLASLKAGFKIPKGDFSLKVISNIDVLGAELAWYNTSAPQHRISEESEGVYGYSRTSKGGVQWQGSCVSEETAMWLSEWFAIIDRGSHFEINGSDTWRDLIELGVAQCGNNFRESLVAD
jgi:hypothetical protein